MFEILFFIVSLIFKNPIIETPPLEKTAEEQKKVSSFDVSPPGKLENNLNPSPGKAAEDQKKVSSSDVSPPGKLENNLNPFTLRNDPVLPELEHPCRRELSAPGTLEEKLNRCEWLRDQIVWEEAFVRSRESQERIRINYTEWPQNKKDRLQQIYQGLVNNQVNLGLNCPTAPDNITSTDHPERNWPDTAVYTSTQAFDIYAAHLAHVLYLEITHQVPWSILNKTPEDLKVFFDSSYRFSHIYYESEGSFSRRVNWAAGNDRGEEATFVAARLNYWTGFEMACDPRVGFKFLTGLTSSSRENLLGSNELETLKNITWWFYENVRHGPLDQTPWRSADGNTYYSYLKDRLKARQITARRGLLVNTGCHSEAHLFSDLATSINIPLLIIGTSANLSLTDTPHTRMNRHAGLVYNWGAPLYQMKVLWHADDLGPVSPTTPFTAFFPVNESGSALDRTQKKQLYFNKTWLSLRELQSFGFVFSNNLNPVTHGAPFADISTGYDTQDDGVYLGYFRPNAASYHGYNELLDLDRSYDLCSGDNLLYDFCHLRLGLDERYTRISFIDSIQRKLNYFSEPLPSGRSTEDFYNRAAQCVQAYGGCDNVMRQIQGFYRAEGMTLNYGTEP